MTYTYKIDETPEIVAWIEKDGYQIIRQPHHPNAYMNEGWKTVEEAEAWASAEVSRLEQTEIDATNQQTKIDEIHSMLLKMTQAN